MPEAPTHSPRYLRACSLDPWHLHHHLVDLGLSCHISLSSFPELRICILQKTPRPIQCSGYKHSMGARKSGSADSDLLQRSSAGSSPQVGSVPCPPVCNKSLAKVWVQWDRTDCQGVSTPMTLSQWRKWWVDEDPCFLIPGGVITEVSNGVKLQLPTVTGSLMHSAWMLPAPFLPPSPCFLGSPLQPSLCVGSAVGRTQGKTSGKLELTSLSPGFSKSPWKWTEALYKELAHYLPGGQVGKESSFDHAILRGLTPLPVGSWVSAAPSQLMDKQLETSNTLSSQGFRDFGLEASGYSFKWLNQSRLKSLS